MAVRAVAANTSGETRLASLGASPAAIAAVETIVMQARLAVGQWQTNGMIRVRTVLSKSGTTDSGRMSVRIGTAGTTADTAITGLSAQVLLSAASQAGGFEFDIKLISATSAQKVGTNAANVSGYGAGNAGAIAAATAITDASANSLYVTVTFSSSGATDTVTVQSGSIQLIAP
jgi:hypothetical protein